MIARHARGQTDASCTQPIHTTMLELVCRLHESTASAEETVEAAVGLLQAGQVILSGNFRGVAVERLFPDHGGLTREERGH